MVVALLALFSLITMVLVTVTPPIVTVSVYVPGAKSFRTTFPFSSVNNTVVKNALKLSDDASSLLSSLCAVISTLALVKGRPDASTNVKLLSDLLLGVNGSMGSTGGSGSSGS